MDAAKALRPLPPGQFCAKENRAMFRAVLIVDKPLVCQRRHLPDRLSTHCVAYGGPVFRRCALRVLAPPAASRPPTASGRGGNAFLRFAPPYASLARCSVPAHFVCSRLQPLRGLQRPATGTGMHFYVSHRPRLTAARYSVPAHFVCSPLQPFGPSPFCKRLLC